MIGTTKSWTSDKLIDVYTLYAGADGMLPGADPGGAQLEKYDLLA